MDSTLFYKCFHGGAFFERVGERFHSLERSRSVINADVLDAWFPPAPAVLDALAEYLPWLLRTSPPTHCAGLIETLADVRGVAPENVLPGAGSSDLIFRALREWLTPSSRVLLLDPTYGEYAHVLERVIGCRIAKFPVNRSEGYAVDLRRLHAVLQGAWDLVILVNPNSPTGRHIPRADFEALLGDIPESTRVWIDETYVDYAGAAESLESFASMSPNVVVCKSMSKVYALSGARVAYLCGHRRLLDPLRVITPPWVVGLPSQVAAVHALQSQSYYADRYAETRSLREDLACELTDLGWEVIPGVANFLLCQLPPDEATAACLVAEARGHDLFLRDASVMGTQLDPRALRIAVKDVVTNQRMVEILREIGGGQTEAQDLEVVGGR
jgi:histidinol-phosphate/aromatic aminotransferase/cobyric acid decarboxylase-like protein